MVNRKSAIAASLLALAAAGAANAQDNVGVPIVAPFDSVVDVEFVSGNALLQTELMWLGYVPGPDMGQLLLEADVNVPGDTVTLGSFAAGQNLWFAMEYMWFPGVEVGYRMDQPHGAPHFAWEQIDADTIRLSVESDVFPQAGQYDDIRADLHFRSVPTPGALALAGTGGLCLLRRKRRA